MGSLVDSLDMVTGIQGSSQTLRYSMPYMDKTESPEWDLLCKIILSLIVFSPVFFFDFRSFEAFIDAVREVNCGNACVADYDEDLASIASTYRTTAILEAGRRSLDEKKAVRIMYDDAFHPCRPTSFAS